MEGRWCYSEGGPGSFVSFFRLVIVPGCVSCSLCEELYLQHSASQRQPSKGRCKAALSELNCLPTACLPAECLLFCVFAFISHCHFVFFPSAQFRPDSDSPSLFLSAVSDASRDSTQSDSAGARRPGQQSFLRLCRKSGDHVGVGSTHWLQPDEPAASEPATGTLVQPGQAESTRSEVITQRCRFHHLCSESAGIMLIKNICEGLLPPSGWLQRCLVTPAAPCGRVD